MANQPPSPASNRSWMQKSNSLAFVPLLTSYMSRLSLVFLLLTALHAETLNEILARMDQSAGSFRGMTSQLTREDYTAAIKDTSEERGTIAMRKNAKGVQGLIDNTFPDKR